jgi:hypothetical protein
MCVLSFVWADVNPNQYRVKTTTMSSPADASSIQVYVRQCVQEQIRSLIASQSRLTQTANALEVIQRILFYSSPVMMVLVKMQLFANAEIYTAVLLSVASSCYSLSDWARREAGDRFKQANTILVSIHEAPLPSGFVEETNVSEKSLDSKQKKSTSPTK